MRRNQSGQKRSRTVEVDVSGVIADTGVVMVLAFSNGASFAILITSQVKRLALKYYRIVHEGEPAPESFYFRLYIIGLSLLLKPHLREISNIVLDTELYGQDNKVRESLFFELGKSVGSRSISFKQIGRKSKAHLKANDVFKKKVGPDRVLSFEEIRPYLDKKKGPVAPRVKATS